jgi:hypothetical protein
MGKARLAIACAVLCVGCRPPRGQVSITSEDPDLQIRAIHQDVQDCDTRDLAGMVAGLQSDDPAIRFYCIQGLQKLTHGDLGYRYYASDEQRAPAVKLWQAWLKQHSPNN